MVIIIEDLQDGYKFNVVKMMPYSRTPKKQHTWWNTESYKSELVMRNIPLLCLEEYVNAFTKILHKCKLCGYEYKCQPSNVLQGQSCPKCAIERNRQAKFKTTESYKEKLSMKNPYLEVLGDYIDCHTKLLHKCLLCGDLIEMNPTDAYKGNGCRKCRRKPFNPNSANKKSLSQDIFVAKLAMNNSNMILIGEYINSNTKALFQYLDCGHTDMVVPYNALKGISGCPICRKAKMSRIMSKSQEEYVKELAIANPNIILIGEYKGARIKTLHKCLKHNIEWETTPGSVLRGSGCKECRKEKTILKRRKPKEKYIQELSISCPTVILIGDYLGTDTKTLHKCLTCGYIWNARPASLLKDDVMFGCPQCVNNYLSESRRFSMDEYKNKAFIVNPNVEVLGDTYINSFTFLKHKCLICGNIWDAYPNTILNGHGCPECAKVAVSIARSKSPEQFLIDFYDKNPSSDYIELLSEYIGSSEAIDCKCLICGNLWSPTADNLLAGQGCPICKSSFGEQIVARYLTKHNIPYEIHKTFDGLYGLEGGKLSYDFYLTDRNTLIERQGKQHAEPIEFFGGEKQFEKQREHDKRKREYAIDNGYNFLEIWYYEDIEQKLNEYLNLETVETALSA